MKKLLLITALATMSACSGIIDDLKTAAQDAAFNAVLDEAKKNGGTAIRVKGGQAATIEITDAASPIKGAAVEIPAGAIPATMKLGVLAVQGSKDFTFPELTTVGTGAVAPSFVGPAVLVVLKAIEGEFDDKLLKVAVVRLPYGASVSAEVKDRLYANHILENPLTELENSKDEAAKTRVSGETLTFSPFAAALRGIPGLIPVANSLTVKVTKAGVEVCSKTIDITAPDYSQGLYYGSTVPPELGARFASSDDQTIFAVMAHLSAASTALAFGADLDLAPNVENIFDARIACDSATGHGVSINTNTAVAGLKFSYRLVTAVESGTNLIDAQVAATLELTEGDLVAQATAWGPISGMEWTPVP